MHHKNLWQHFVSPNLDNKECYKEENDFRLFIHLVMRSLLVAPGDVDSLILQLNWRLV